MRREYNSTYTYIPWCLTQLRFSENVFAFPSFYSKVQRARKEILYWQALCSLKELMREEYEKQIKGNFSLR